MDTTGRMRRLVIALLLGGAAAALAFFICDSLAKPDDIDRGQHSMQHISGAYKFVYYVTALAGAIVFSIAIAVQNHLAKKKWQSERVPTAKVR